MLELPNKYESKTEEFKQFNGIPKLSYSAYTSFNEEAYKGEFFANKFLGIPNEGNIFTTYGSGVGTFMETGEENEVLSDFDKEVLLTKIGRPEGAVYEKEIVIKRDGYCIQGFIDRCIFDGKYVDVVDFKSGSISSKAKFYGGDDYNQTLMYSYALEEMGYIIRDCGVLLADRKGNGQEKHPLRLTGEVLYIPTPYTREKAEKFLKKFDKTAKEIEEYWKVFNKFFAQ